MTALRVGSYNILHGMRVLGGSVEGDTAALPEAVASLDVDVLGMQEVDYRQPRSGLVDQTAQAAAALGADHWKFVPTVAGTPGPAGQFRASRPSDLENLDPDQPLYGVGLVSRIPVLQWRYMVMRGARVTMPLLVPGNPRPRVLRVPDEPRAVIAAVLDLPTPVTVATAHLSFVPGFNISQLRRLKNWLAQMPRPLLLVGDFNMPGNLPRRITGWTAADLGPTYPVFRPRVRFDHILGDQIEPQQPQVHALEVSDHCAVTARCSL